MRSHATAGRNEASNQRRGAMPSVVACVALLLLVIMPWLTGKAGLAQSMQSPEGLTRSLASLSVQYHAADSSQKADLLAQLVNVALQRHELLAALMESDPARVLKVAVPGSLRASLPTQVQGYVEEEVQLEGDLEVIHEDRFDGSSRYLYWLNTATGRVSLHFTGEAPSLLTGTRVRVQGVLLDQAMALSSGSSVQRLMSSRCDQPGPYPELSRESAEPAQGSRGAPG